MRIDSIGFGAVKIGRNRGIKYPHPYALPDDRTAERLLNGVLDLGINLVDTAPAYGISEERIGRFLAHRRDEFRLSTKVGEAFRDGASSYDFSAQGMRQSVERSLRRLRRERLDILLIHSSRDDLRVLLETEAVPTLLALRQEGLARAIGLSGYTDAGFREALPWADVLMLEYNPSQRGHEGLIAEASARGIAILVKKGLGSGQLDAEESIAFALSNPHIDSLVLGSLNLAHLQSAVKVAAQLRSR